MVIDTSAILAVLFKEPEAAEFLDRIASDPLRLVSAAGMLEASMVIETRYGETGGHELDLFLDRIDVEIVAIDAELAEAARHA